MYNVRRIVRLRSFFFKLGCLFGRQLAQELLRINFVILDRNRLIALTSKPAPYRLMIRRLTLTRGESKNSFGSNSMSQFLRFGSIAYLNF